MAKHALKLDKKIMYFKDTDIPPMGTRQFMLYGEIQELIKKNNTNIFTLDEIFHDYTYKKKQRFDMFSRLIKNKIIKAQRIQEKKFKIQIIPQDSYIEASEMRVYYVKNKNHRINLMEKLKKGISA